MPRNRTRACAMSELSHFETRRKPSRYSVSRRRRRCAGRFWLIRSRTECPVKAHHLDLVYSPGSVDDGPPVHIRAHLIDAQAFHYGSRQAGDLDRIGKQRGARPPQWTVNGLRAKGLARLGGDQLPEGFAAQESTHPHRGSHGSQHGEEDSCGRSNPKYSAPFHNVIEPSLENNRRQWLKYATKEIRFPGNVCLP